MSTKRNRMQPSKLKKGDKVALKQSNSVYCLSPNSSESAKETANYIKNNPRQGVVTEVYVKLNKAGHRRHHAKIRWDGSKATSDHEQSRILLVAAGLETPETEVVEAPKTKVVEGKVKEKVVVGKKEKKTKLVEINNLEEVEGRGIFTAKVNGLYVGCVRFEHGICISEFAFDSGLAAANKARHLKKQLFKYESVVQKPGVLKKKDNTHVITQQHKHTQKSTMRNNKVSCYRDLYTFAETQEMPLLKFKEIWVVTHGNSFVSDCLNSKTKKLVTLSPHKNKAKYFYDHEEAKNIMNVLKDTVGPGFNLQRFFIKN